MSTPTTRGRGRRPGTPDTRAEILAAARAAFAASGFARTSVRAVAAAAGVDPALVHHFFGGKDGLFAAALDLPLDPREVLAPVLVGGADGAGERLLRAFLGAWDDPALQDRLVAMARGFLEPDGNALLRDAFLPAVLGPLAEGLGIDDAERRTSLVAGQLVGLLVTRYLVRLEPVASMPAEELVVAVGPTLQRYLTGPLG